MKVRHSTKILLAGLGLSALVLAASYMNTLRLERRLSALQVECERPPPSNAKVHGPWEKYAANGPDTVPVRMPDGTVVRLPNKVDEAIGKQLRAESEEATARAAGVDQKATLHFVLDPLEDYFVPPDKVPPGANVFDQFDTPPPKWALDYVRATYPQYSDLSDEELGRRLNQKYQGPASRRDPLVCDARKLVLLSADVNVDNTEKLVGIQAKIVEADGVARNSRSWPLSVALTLFGLSAMPWLWYALLRRIGELRAAIGGNPPEA